MNKHKTFGQLVKQTREQYQGKGLSQMELVALLDSQFDFQLKQQYLSVIEAGEKKLRDSEHYVYVAAALGLPQSSLPMEWKKPLPQPRRTWPRGSPQSKLTKYLQQIVKTHGLFHQTKSDKFYNEDKARTVHTIVPPLLRRNQAFDFESKENRKKTRDELKIILRSQCQLFQEVVKDHPRLILLGIPGSGKTSLCKLLSVSLAVIQPELLENQLYNALEKRIPVFLRLRDLSASITVRTWPELWAAFLQKTCGIEIPQHEQDALTAAVDQGMCLILVDGFDELDTVKRKQNVNMALLDAMNDEFRGKNRFILTSRIMGYEDNVALDASKQRNLTEEGLDALTVPETDEKTLGLVRYHIVSFDDERIRDAAKRYNTARYEPTQAEELAEGLIKEIFKNPNLHLLARNPLILNMMCTLRAERGYIPNGRSELYKELTDYFVAIKPKLAKQTYPDHITTDDIHAHLAFTAYQMQKQRAGGELGAIKITKDKLIDMFAENMKTRFSTRGKTVEDRQKIAGDLVEFLRNTAGLIQENNGRMEFLHLTVLEYFAAVYITKNSTDFLAKDSHLKPNDDVWLETIILLFEILAFAEDQEKINTLAYELFPELDGKLEEKTWQAWKKANLAVRSQVLHTLATNSTAHWQTLGLADTAQNQAQRWLILSQWTKNSTKLDLTSSIITDVGLTHLPQVLTTLWLDSTDITDAGISLLPRALTTLYLRNTNITDAGIPHLPETLTTLSLRNTNITDAGLEYLPKKLTSLSLENTQVSDIGMKKLPESLTTLWLENTAVTANGINELKWRYEGKLTAYR